MTNFVDEAQLHAKGGDGGAGAVSFRREAHVSRGGPDGGDGGAGGDVWLVAGTGRSSLISFRDHPHRKAGDGSHGRGAGRHGARGQDLEVTVPVGTVVRSLDGEVLADLSSPGERWLAAAGGRGARGNARFLSNNRRAPSFAEQGERGEERWYDLELKLIADVALVGMPNAGKSTFISRVSAARPKVADYPFTTLEPHLGVVRVGRPGDDVEIVIADVPGLVEGAADGRGLGHRFLRHVERARVLLVLVDLSEAAGHSAQAQEEILIGEIRRYRSELLERPRIVVGTKADLAGGTGAGTGGGAAPGSAGVQASMPARQISSVTGQGIAELLGELATLVSAERAAQDTAAPSMVVHRPVPEGIEVTRCSDGTFTVSGRAALRAVALNDLSDEQAAGEVRERLRRIGVERALVRAGVRDGDTVHIGEVDLTYESDELVHGQEGEPSGRRAARAERVGRAGRAGQVGREGQAGRKHGKRGPEGR
ncbi:MAG: GTPase ObgE [Acidimicrobiales bacterium]|nr:GTPase ObgE [Actinomycetota bacterium]